MKEALAWYKEKHVSIRAVRQWNRLHRGIVQSPSLEVFKTQLDKALHKLNWPYSWPCFGQGFGLDISWCPFLVRITLRFYIQFNIAGLNVIDLHKARYVRNFPLPLGAEMIWLCKRLIVIGESNIYLPLSLTFPLKLSNMLERKDSSPVPGSEQQKPWRIV